MSNIRNIPMILLGLFATGQVCAAIPTCLAAANENRVAWPSTQDPIWDMCWVRVSNSSGPRGSGLELRNIHFRGVLLVKRSHAPILFAEYKDGQGGNCYRDWKDENSNLIAEPAVRNVLGTPVNFTATTNCDVSSLPDTAYGSCPFGQPGRTAADCGGAGVVALENLPNNLGMRITSQYTAGWYKYTARYVFGADGSIAPEFGFGNSDGTFNDITHWHHNYWRFDFDIDGAANDVVLQGGVKQTAEFSALRGRDEYSVVDALGGFGYTITPGANDNTFPANQSGRNFHTTDVIGSLYKANEYSDRTTNALNDCTMTPNAIANGENIDQKDVVLYYRASVRDTGLVNGWAGATADPMICKRAGPRFSLVGNFPIADGDFLYFKNGAE